MLSRVAGVGLLLSIAACVGATPVLEDTLGTRVTWMCEGHDCQVTGTSVAPPDCDGSDIFAVSAGAIALLCAASVADDHVLTLHEATCRPLLCAMPSDCPQWPDREYGCDGGICTTAGRALDMLDVEATCLHTAARLDTCAEIDADPNVTRAMSMAMTACAGGTCGIPTECRP